jgi:ribonuclease HI
VPLLIKGDSKLVVHQVSGMWRCHKPHLDEVRERAWSVLAQVVTCWIPREENEEADLLSKDASSQQSFDATPLAREG